MTKHGLNGRAASGPAVDLSQPLTPSVGRFHDKIAEIPWIILVFENGTYARFLNIDPAAQIGKHATAVVANTRLRIVARTGIAEVNYPHEFKDIGFLVHRIPIREDGKIIAVLGVNKATLFWYYRFKSQVSFFVFAMPIVDLERHPHDNLFGFPRIDPLQSPIYAGAFIEFHDR
ncbi:MAG: hypothetical protein WAL90_15620 [Desulfobacterales bacterium]